MILIKSWFVNYIYNLEHPFLPLPSFADFYPQIINLFSVIRRDHDHWLSLKRPSELSFVYLVDVTLQLFPNYSQVSSNRETSMTDTVRCRHGDHPPTVMVTRRRDDQPSCRPIPHPSPLLCDLERSWRPGCELLLEVLYHRHQREDGGFIVRLSENGWAWILVYPTVTLLGRGSPRLGFSKPPFPYLRSVVPQKLLVCKGTFYEYHLPEGNFSCLGWWFLCDGSQHFSGRPYIYLRQTLDGWLTSLPTIHR